MDDAEGAVNTSSCDAVAVRVVASTLRFVVVAGCVEGEAISEIGAEDIMRFWNSRCLFLSLSKGSALRAIPSI